MTSEILGSIKRTGCVNLLCIFDFTHLLKQKFMALGNLNCDFLTKL